jgi:DNA-binding NarL/FixJ family response regulator
LERQQESGLSFLIVEDEPMVARALARCFERYGKTKIAASIREAEVDLHPPLRWTALCLDIELPDGCGLTLLESLREAGCEVPAVVVTGSCAPEYINRAQISGAEYVVKPNIGHGIDAFMTRTADQQRARLASCERAVMLSTAKWGFTAREAQVVELHLRGLRRSEVSKRLGITEDTLRDHVQSILRKTNARNMREFLGRLLLGDA